ncbi:vWA domain-containing protein [Steroidobacter sp.]|uniref:vWA domain-containing protein n=1 Tax=Steroidobacter sp. TaxID=1978227 RepID=UPI001A636F55|nr:VWA domain-containing protein [Steroidobacter sp.]MBL8264750.1 VWA domain-containing protein [Steroidobacter sp.]
MHARSTLTRLVWLFLLGTSLAWGAPALQGPATANIGAVIPVSFTGSDNPRDFISIVPKSTPEGKYDAYEYATKSGKVELRVPATPGDYEIRLLAASSPYPTLARVPLKVVAVTATLEAPAQVAAGANFEVKWTGPNNERDYIAIGNAERPYLVYAYTRGGSPAKLRALDVDGDYELRYFLGNGDKVIATRKLSIGKVSASVTAPAQAAAGAKFQVKWQGPNNPQDFIAIVKAGAPERTYSKYEYTRAGNPVELRAPDAAGDYEIRYLTGQSYATLASTKIAIGAADASVQGPAEAVAGSAFNVTWKGPNNQSDYITVVAKGAREGTSGYYKYSSEGSPAKLIAPLQAGDYEIWYATGQSHTTLAKATIRVTPAKQEPGKLLVTATTAVAAGGGIEIILDASGSMLQKIGGQRRIDIAKQTLTKLTSAGIPAGTPFAFRVFGREVDSCQTDLDIALSPLNAAAVGAKINALEAKNNARTPIGASLEKVSSDLAAVKGERLVVLLTDGEETCGGDPAAAIAALNKAGTTVRVNIVGFAIEDPKLAVTFSHWASLGNGSYFDAKDAAGLSNALTQSLRSSFEVVTAQGQVVASGVTGSEAVSVLPGTYTVRIKGQSSRAQSVTIEPKATATVKL